MLNREGKPSTLVPDFLIERICDFSIGMNQHLKDIDAFKIIVDMERAWRFKPREVRRGAINSFVWCAHHNVEVVKASDYDEIERKLNEVINLLEKANGEVAEDYFEKLWMAACPERKEYLE